MGFPAKYTDSSWRLWTLLDDGSHAGPKDVREEQNGLVSVAECRQQWRIQGGGIGGQVPPFAGMVN